jgi:superfamily II DNA or RNA helicase
MDAFICERGIAINTNQFIERFGNEALLKLKRSLTISTVDRVTKIPKKTAMFTVVKTPEGPVLEVPKYCLGMLRTKKYVANITIDLATGERMRHEYVGQSNPNQQLVVNHVIKHLRDHSQDGFNGFTLKLMAGTGKSFCAMDIISKVKRKTLIVVPNTYLLNQWVKLLTEYFPTATIGELYGKRKVDGDIIVGIINTVADLDSFEVSTKLPLANIGKTVKYMKQVTTVSVDELYNQIGLTIYDESQMYVSKEFRKAFQRARSRFTIGLSATPDIREDKLDRIHLAWVGPILDADQLEHYSPAQDAFQSTATLIKYHGLDEHVQFKIRDDGMMDYQSIIEALVNDPHRNQLLVDQILKLAKGGYYVFVFSDRRSHLEQLYETMTDLLETNPMDTPVNLEMPEASRKIILYGGSSEQTIQKANDISNIIFTTYQYSSTGVSIKKMDCLVLTTPRRSNMTQIINRVFRLGSDQTIERQIIDILDVKLPIKNQYKERLKAYKERGSTIIYQTHMVE